MSNDQEISNGEATAVAGSTSAGAVPKTRRRSGRQSTNAHSCLERSTTMLVWLLAPQRAEEVLERTTTPTLITGKPAEYFAPLLSYAAIETLARRCLLHDERGELLTPARYQRRHAAGEALRLRRIERYLPSVHTCVSELQESLRCAIEPEAIVLPASATLNARPPAPGGAFCIVVEGAAELQVDTLLDKTVASAADVLYVPAGCCWRANSLDGQRGLLLCLTLQRHNSYGALYTQLLSLLRKRLDALTTTPTLQLRWPRDAWQSWTPKRRLAQRTAKNLFTTLVRDLGTLVDDAFDQLGVEYQRRALPPSFLTLQPAYARCDQPLQNADVKVRLVRASSMQLARTGDGNHFRLHWQAASMPLQQQAEVDTIRLLTREYPRSVRIADFLLASDDLKLQFANKLWDLGLIMPYD